MTDEEKKPTKNQNRFRRSGVRFDKRKKELFLAQLAKLPNITLACRAAGIARQTAFVHRRADPKFSQSWNDALETSLDILEEEVINRGFFGDEVDIVYEGAVTGTTKRKSDLLAMFLLKRYRPEFRENFALNVSGDINHHHTLEEPQVNLARRLLFDASRRMQLALQQEPDLRLLNHEVLKRRFLNESLRGYGIDELPLDPPPQALPAPEAKAVEPPVAVVPIEEDAVQDTQDERPRYPFFPSREEQGI